MLSLFFGSSCGGRSGFVVSRGHFYDSVCECGELENCGIVEESLLSTYLADVELNRGGMTYLFCPLMWTCSAKAVAAQLMQGSWTQLSMSIWSLGLLQRLQV